MDKKVNVFAKKGFFLALCLIVLFAVCVIVLRFTDIISSYKFMLILCFVGLIIFFIFAIFSIILCINGIKKRKEYNSGNAFAVFGIILSIILIIVLAIFSLALFYVYILIKVFSGI